jgi:hypothetical protein
MYFLLFIILLLLVFVYLLFIKPAAVSLYLNTDTDSLNLTFNWLSIVKADIQYRNGLFLTIRLWGLQFYQKAIRPKAGKKRVKPDAYRALSLHNSNAYVRYGLGDPFSTGIACGILDIIQYYLKDVVFTQTPDFMPDRDYLILEADTELYIGKTIYNYLRLKAKNSKPKRRNQYGSVQYVRQR